MNYKATERSEESKAPLTTTKENGSPSKTLTTQGGTKTLPPSQSDKATKTEGSSPSAITRAQPKPKTPSVSVASEILGMTMMTF